MRETHLVSAMVMNPTTISEAEQALAGGQPAAAIEMFRSHISQNPADQQVLDTLERLFLAVEQGRYYVEFFRDIQKNSPEEPQHLLNLARAYSKTNKDSLAVVQLQKLLRADGSQRDGWSELALCYIRLNKQELAQRALNSLLDLHPNYDQAHVERVRVLLDAGEAREAMANAIFSLECKGISSEVRDWLENISGYLELNLQPDPGVLAVPKGLR